ncbi:hypothetical protein ABNZ43_10905 [Weissella sp. GP1]|uniref:Uncharacterized protein n=2 Tax=Weissella TaxID=46255 RepID=A0AAJ3DBL3_WEICO|nr:MULTISPECIES: hypothetical protein [Weissella]MBJ7689065.1 hypothetical protein [Weissella confusa]MBJ7695428.1 hypothetical protein [Weissella confusa]MCW0927230.1 hypothetical protein [Weissella sp. LMG 11983]MDF9299672.1 hypothetical protein [Weissella sp. BK2]NBA11488.1 hypothetical protein [Weissella confusa]
MTKLTRQILILVIFSGLLLGFYVIAIYGPKATRYTVHDFNDTSAPLTAQTSSTSSTSNTSSAASSSAIDYSRAPANNHQDYQSTFMDKDIGMNTTANGLQFSISHINILDTTNLESLFSPAEKEFVRADVSLPYEFYRVTLRVTITNNTNQAINLLNTNVAGWTLVDGNGQTFTHSDMRVGHYMYDQFNTGILEPGDSKSGNFIVLTDSNDFDYQQMQFTAARITPAQGTNDYPVTFNVSTVQ